MKITIRKYLLLISISLVIFSCDDFIEKDIESETITLLAPTNNVTTIQLTHTFWWDWLDGAEQYTLQIVEGSFSAATNFIIDTTVTVNKFNYTLYPGSFQWRVRGENNGHVTYFSTHNIEIDSSLNIASQQVILTSPTDLIITNNNNVTFNWNNLLNADDYLIEIHQNTWEGAIVFGPQVINTNTYTTTLPEGTLVWGVQARNAISNSSTRFSTRTIVVDTTRPEPPILLAPIDNASLADVFNTYSWNQGINSGTALTDVIYFYNDAAATVLNKSVSIPSGTTHQDSLGAGSYYWAVQSTDAAGNIGPFSTLRRVVIQ